MTKQATTKTASTPTTDPSGIANTPSMVMYETVQDLRDKGQGGEELSVLDQLETELQSRDMEPMVARALVAGLVRHLNAGQSLRAAWGCVRKEHGLAKGTKCPMPVMESVVSQVPWVRRVSGATSRKGTKRTANPGGQWEDADPAVQGRKASHMWTEVATIAGAVTRAREYAEGLGYNAVVRVLDEIAGSISRLDQLSQSWESNELRGARKRTAQEAPKVGDKFTANGITYVVTALYGEYDGDPNPVVWAEPEGGGDPGAWNLQKEWKDDIASGAVVLQSSRTKTRTSATFRLDPSNTMSIAWTAGRGEVAMSPAALVRKFGQPGRGDDYKISGEYIFSDDQGNVWTVYDWKSTSLFSRDYPDPETFWQSEELYPFQVGGKSGGNVGEFIAWVQG